MTIAISFRNTTKGEKIPRPFARATDEAEAAEMIAYWAAAQATFSRPARREDVKKDIERTILGTLAGMGGDFPFTHCRNTAGDEIQFFAFIEPR